MGKDFHSIAKAEEYIQSSFPLRHEALVGQPFSDRSYNDPVRLLNDLMALLTDQQVEVRFDQHTAEYLSCPNARLLYKDIDLAKLVPEDIDALTTK